MTKKQRIAISPLSGIFVVFLVLILIILGERLLFDLNQWINPLADSFNALRGTEMDQYRLYRLIIHSGLVLPLFLAVFLLHNWIDERPEKKQYKIISTGYIAFGLWMMLRMIIEIGVYIIEVNRVVGMYVLLGAVVALLTWFMVRFQRKANRT
jgi:uncharacterized BrkB/YihY/UPF0761 family membrane protein